MKTVSLNRIIEAHGLEGLTDEVFEYFGEDKSELTRDEYCVFLGAFDIEAPDDGIFADFEEEETKETGLGLFNEHGRVVVSSRVIAENFGKNHFDVLRAIKNMECSENFVKCNFALNEYKDSIGRSLPEYLITRQGFCFLAMGFTGKRAAQWKEKYIEAFDAMERRLTEPELPSDDIDYKRAKFLVDGAMAFRDVMSRDMRREIMQEYYALGGFDIEENGTPITLEDEVENFINTRCRIGKGCSCSRADFYEAFRKTSPVYASRCAVSRAVNALRLYPQIRTGMARSWGGFALA